MKDEPTNARKSFGDIAPHLAEITDKVLFGDVWDNPALSPRDRSLVTIASLIALYRINETPFHLKRALENGVTREEIIAAITHLAFYAGWPPAMTAFRSPARSSTRPAPDFGAAANKESRNADPRAWKKRPEGFGHRPRLHGHELSSRSGPRPQRDGRPDRRDGRRAASPSSTPPRSMGPSPTRSWSARRWRRSEMTSLSPPSSATTSAQAASTAAPKTFGGRSKVL